MEILQEDYCRDHGDRPSAALLAQELYSRRESSAFTRHSKHGEPLSYAALVQTERLSLDAATVLRDWTATLSSRAPLLEMRDVLARAMRHLGATPQMIAMVTTRDVPEFPDALWDSLADNPVSSWFVVHAVLLRRCQYGAPVHKAMAQAWRTGVALVQNCLARPCLYSAAPIVWKGALQFVPSHLDVIRFGGIDDTGRLQAHSLPTRIAESSFQYNALIRFVPATLAGERPRWCEKFPPEVAQFIQRASLSQDLGRISRLTSDDSGYAQDWGALLSKKHDVFSNSHVLLQKLSKTGVTYLPVGLPKTFH